MDTVWRLALPKPANPFDFRTVTERAGLRRKPPTIISATAPPPCSPRWRGHRHVVDRCYDRHGKAEFLDFLKTVARAYPR